MRRSAADQNMLQGLSASNEKRQMDGQSKYIYIDSDSDATESGSNISTEVDIYAEQCSRCGCRGDCAISISSGDDTVHEMPAGEGTRDRDPPPTRGFRIQRQGRDTNDGYQGMGKGMGESPPRTREELGESPGLRGQDRHQSEGPVGTREPIETRPTKRPRPAGRGDQGRQASASGGRGGT